MSMYIKPLSGFDSPKAITPANIGPVQGVQPAANPIPIKIEPM